MKLDINILNSYVEKGLLRNQSHPTLPLLIWNYTETCQYEGIHWDSITLMCRGLITDTDGNIVGRPFRKFFNIEENKYTSTKEFVVLDKMDGSLGILYYYNDDWFMATRGSFTSDQAIEGEKIFKTKYPNYKNELIPGFTYCWEIIYPQNRIVVDYGNLNDTILLAKIYNETGEDENIIPYQDKFSVVKMYNFKDYTNIQELNWENSEGFIVMFSNNDRVKIKFKDYVELHRVITNTSTRTVWEHLRDGKSMEDLVKNVPDEFFSWLTKTVNDLQSQYNDIELRAKQFVEENKELDQKEFALKLLNDNDYKSISGVCFTMRNNRDYSSGIWRMIEPAYEKAFSI